jgi:predicted GNAT family acetyltransferase
MRAMEFISTETINEITPFTPEYDPSDVIPGIDYSWTGSGKLNQIKTASKPLKPKFRIAILPAKHRHDGGYVYVITDEGEVVSYVSYSIAPDHLSISDVYVLKKARGNNLAVEMYKRLMKQYKKPLVSDVLQTRKGQRLWSNLYADPEINVMGLVSIQKAYTDALKPELEKLGAEYYKNIDHYWDTYLVPVKQLASLKRLQFKKRNQIIKLYDPSNYEPRVDTTLIAFLKGQK